MKSKKRHGPARTFFFRCAWVLGALYLVYAVGANLVLNTSILGPVISKKPEKMLVEWGSGWSIVPGVVHIHDLRIRGQSKAMQWQCRIDGGKFSISLLSLAAKTVKVTRGRGSDFSFYTRTRMDAPNGAPANPEFMAEIEGFSNPPDPRPEDLYPAKPKKNKPWHIIVSNVVFDGPVDLWLYQLRVRGHGTVGGSVDYLLRNEIELTSALLDLTETAVTVGGDTLVQDVDLDVNAALAPFSPKGTRAMEILGQFRGDIHLDAGLITDLAVLNAFFHEGGGVKMIAGEGRVDLKLSASEPQAAKGSFDLVVEGAQFATGGAEVSGDIAVHAALQQGDLVEGHFDVSGTRVDLEQMILPDPKREQREAKAKAEAEGDDTWWMWLEVVDGAIDLGYPAGVDMTVNFAMKDTRPLLRTFFAKPRADGEKTKLPGWVGVVPNIQEIEGDASFDMGPEGTIIDDVAITGTKTEMMARLRLREGLMDGNFYVKHGIVSLGVDLAAGKTKLKLSKPKQWFIAQPEYDDSKTLVPPSEREVEE